MHESLVLLRQLRSHLRRPNAHLGSIWANIAHVYAGNYAALHRSRLAFLAMSLDQGRCPLCLFAQCT